MFVSGGSANDLGDHSGSFVKTSGSSLTIFRPITQRHSWTLQFSLGAEATGLLVVALGDEESLSTFSTNAPPPSFERAETRRKHKKRERACRSRTRFKRGAETPPVCEKVAARYYSQLTLVRSPVNDKYVLLG